MRNIKIYIITRNHQNITRDKRCDWKVRRKCKDPLGGIPMTVCDDMMSFIKMI